MRFRYKKAYLKQFDHLSHTEKELIIAADREIHNYYTSHIATYGLRIKKLFEDGADKIFEARVSDKIRILWLQSGDLVTFAFLGDHDEVRNYIKSFR